MAKITSNKSWRSVTFVSFVLWGLGGAVSADPIDYPGTMCKAKNPDDDITYSSSGWIVNKSAHARRVVCPIPHVRPNTGASITIHWDNSGGEKLVCRITSVHFDGKTGLEQVTKESSPKKDSGFFEWYYAGPSDGNSINRNYLFDCQLPGQKGPNKSRIRGYGVNEFY